MFLVLCSNDKVNLRFSGLSRRVFLPTPWILAVQQTMQLTVCPGDQLKKAPAWGEGLFTRILDEFNLLANTNLLGVRLVRSDKKPSFTSADGANVLFEASANECKFFDHNGNEQTATLRNERNRLHGLTATVRIPAVNKIGWAFSFMPLNPVVGKMPAGPNVKMAIGLHELLHACGLASEDPGHDPPQTGSGDIFDGFPVVFEGDDHEFAGGSLQPDRSGHFFLRNSVKLVQSIWLLGRF
jgi:hypothetical protein